MIDWNFFFKVRHERWFLEERKTWCIYFEEYVYIETKAQLNIIIFTNIYFMQNEKVENEKCLLVYM